MFVVTLSASGAVRLENNTARVEIVDDDGEKTHACSNSAPKRSFQWCLGCYFSQRGMRSIHYLNFSKSAAVLEV